MLRVIACLLCLCLALSCGKKEVSLDPSQDDFASLCGKNLPSWSHVQTKEDFERLQFFGSLYEGLKTAVDLPSVKTPIPHVIHFIWVGPKPFPRESVDNVRSWMGKHPGWVFKFWTDRQRPLPCPGMELHLIQELQSLQLGEYLTKTTSYAEKADLLRYDILYQEGGVYVDHDVKCFKAFDPLNQAYDFYCGIDMPAPISLASCIVPTNNLIGIIPHHPILFDCIQRVRNLWESVEEGYPGVDPDEVLNRVLHRTFWPFGEAVRLQSGKEGRKDIVFPAYYFDAPNDALALYARHLYAGTWFTREKPFEKMVRERLMLLSKKSNKTLLFLSLGLCLNTCGIISIFVLLKKKRTSHDS